MELDTRPTMLIRRSFAEKHLNLGGLGLEIGGYDRPLFRPSERRVKFLDYYSTEELRGFAARDGVQPEAIEAVDYVVKSDEFAREISERFDYVIASHVVEHVPDTINWFKNIEAVLKPEGRLFLIVPDKRYTFDYLRPLTTSEDVFRNHEQRRSAPSFDSVFQNIFMFRHVDAAARWKGEDKPQDQPGRFDVATAWKIACEYFERQDRSIHSHVYTSTSFLGILKELHAQGATKLKECGFYDVWNPSNEFFVALEMS
jgi:predicted SAM-dependent methyltransferase